MTWHPYRLSESALVDHLDDAIDATFADLTSQFMLMPRGDAFVTYEDFNAGYEALRTETANFTNVTQEMLWAALRKDARAFLVLRSVLGVSPPEWAALATEELGVPNVNQQTARTLDSRVKRDAAYFTRVTPTMQSRVASLLLSAVIVLTRGAGTIEPHLVNRLEKFDTVEGLPSLRNAVMRDVPYSVLLYERFLGRPYASHRDAVSELVGDVMENAIEVRLHEAGIPARKTARAERIPGFDQAPDFIVPNELIPAVVLEAKITADDGTARDKVARILRLARMRDERRAACQPSFEVIACIDGRGFKVRRHDMRDMIVACEGKVFTLETLPDLVKHSRLRDFLPNLHRGEDGCGDDLPSGNPLD